MNIAIDCPKCGCAASPGQMGEIMEIDLQEQNVLGVVRRFGATCPACGPFFYDKPGHHGTLTAKQMKQRFPEKTRKAVRNALSPGERKKFNDALAGRREPKDEDLERWLAIQSRILRG